MFEPAVRKFPFVIKGVPDRYKIPDMFDKAILENQSQFLIDIGPIKVVPKYFKAQEMCDKAVNTCSFLFHSVSAFHKTQEMCDSVVSEIVQYTKTNCLNTHRTTGK